MMIELNRFKLIGEPLDENTPRCVWKEIADAHCVKLPRNHDHKDIMKMQHYNYKIFINDDFPKCDLGKLASYVNRYGKWTRNQLIQAYEYMTSFESKDSQPPLNWSAEPASKDHIKVLNCCLLYKFTRDMDCVNFNTTKDELILYLRIKQMSAVYLQDRLIQYIKEDPYKAAAALKIIPQRFDVRKYPAIIKPMIVPKILTGEQYDTSYESKEWTDYWRKKNIRVLQHYNPSHIYLHDGHVISDYLLAEGYSKEEIMHLGDGITSELNTAILCRTFYRGDYPKRNLTCKTMYHEDPDELDGNYLLYGALYEELRPVTLEELIASFKAGKDFSISLFEPHEMLSEKSVNKLMLLYPDSQALKDAIKEVRYNHVSQDEALNKLAETYSLSVPTYKEKIKNIINQILYIGMYMRGWDGESEYPVIDTIVTLERTDEVELNVSTSIIKLKDLLEEVPDLNPIITSLPLVRHKGGHYVKSININDGLTIMERINIVQTGNTSEDEASCIRLSSNWICSSAHMYLVKIGEKEPFDLASLREIS